MTAQVIVSELNKRFGAVTAAANISFMIAEGEIFGLLGANGAGKTTVLECLVGLQQPDSGELRIGGVDVLTHPRIACAQLGVSLQNSGLPDYITAREALRLFGSFHERRIDADELLRRFSLVEKTNAPYRTLSVGQRQRLALALTMVNDPAVLVLDEPSNGLDPQARHEFHDLLRAAKAAGKTVLLSTHDLAEAEELCDRVAVLSKGRMVAMGSPSELRDAVKHQQNVLFRSNPTINVEKLGRLAGVQNIVTAGPGHRLVTTDPQGTVKELNKLVLESRSEILELQIEAHGLAAAYRDIMNAIEREPSP